MIRKVKVTLHNEQTREQREFIVEDDGTLTGSAVLDRAIGQTEDDGTLWSLVRFDLVSLTVKDEDAADA